jgi:hypothetical protein
MTQVHVFFDQLAYGALHIAPTDEQVSRHFLELLEIGAFINGFLVDSQ